jgi:hypothetical protein
MILLIDVKKIRISDYRKIDNNAVMEAIGFPPPPARRGGKEFSM